MKAPVDAYLDALWRELERRGVVDAYDALDDAREYLDSELWRCRSARPELDEPEAFERVAAKFGTPAEVARATKEAEGTGPAWLERVRRLRRFSYAPGWKIGCTSCGRSGDLEAAAPFSVRWLARSWKKLTGGWCSECRRLRFLKIWRLS